MKEGKLEIIVGSIVVGGFLLTIGALSKLQGNTDSQLYTGLACGGVFSMIASTYIYAMTESIRRRNNPHNNSEVYSQ